MWKIISAGTGLKAYVLKLMMIMIMMIFYNKGPKKIHAPEEKVTGEWRKLR
jgi:hypothetical protein